MIFASILAKRSTEYAADIGSDSELLKLSNGMQVAL
jgi:hypothetical protein